MCFQEVPNFSFTTLEGLDESEMLKLLDDEATKIIFDRLQDIAPKLVVDRFIESKRGTEAAIFRSPTNKRITICFRGTEVSIYDFFTDLLVFKRPLSPGLWLTQLPGILFGFFVPRVHMGFHHAYYMVIQVGGWLCL